MEELLKVTNDVLKRNRISKTNKLDIAVVKALSQMKIVLNSGNGLKGFNRKVQIRPISWKINTEDILTDESLESSYSRHFSFPSSSEINEYKI